MEFVCPLHDSQENATGAHPEPVQSSPDPQTSVFFNTGFVLTEIKLSLQSLSTHSVMELCKVVSVIQRAAERTVCPKGISFILKAKLW
jgi:hypothetical protein